MNRRRLMLALGAAVALGDLVFDAAAADAAGLVFAWSRVPAVTILAAEGDSRLP